MYIVKKFIELYQAQLLGYDITFDTLYVVDYPVDNLTAELEDIEAKYINTYLPALNLSIPIQHRRKKCDEVRKQNRKDWEHLLAKAANL